MKSWTLTTRLLHLGLAVTVTFQLLVSLIMERPEEGEKVSELAALFWEFHEVVGVVAVGVVALHWLWMLKSPDTGVSHLFPWGAKGREQIARDTRSVFQGRLLDGGPGSAGLVGLIHGLGFLAVTAMAVSGAVLFVGLPEDGSKPGEIVHWVMEGHEVLSNLAWLYFIGHVGMAVLHKRRGHPTVQNMFHLRR